MKALIYKDTLKIERISEESYIGFLKADGHCFELETSITDPRFAKVVKVPAVLTKYKKDDVEIETCPQVEDVSWTHVLYKAAVVAVEGVPYQPAVEASPEVLAQDAVLDEEGNVITPAVEYKPAVEARPEVLAVEAVQAQPEIVEHWAKDGMIVYEQPMCNDLSYEVVPGVPEHYEVVEDVEAKTTYDVQQAAQAEEAEGQKVRSCCDKILNVVIGYNMKNLTSEQITQMQTEYSTVLANLQAFRPNEVKKGLLLITELPELKDRLLSILAEFGF